VFGDLRADGIRTGGKIHETFCFTFAGLVLPAAVASAATISIQPHAPVLAGTSATITLLISGGEQIAGAQTLLIIGDGGPDLGGTTNAATAPHIVPDLGVNTPANPATTSTIVAPTYIFGAVANGGNQYLQLDVGNGPNPLGAFNGTTTASGTVAASGTLMSFIITVPASNQGGPVTLDLNLDNTSVIGATTIAVQGTTLTIIPLPEPASALMLVGALPFMRRRRTA